MQSGMECKAKRRPLKSGLSGPPKTRGACAPAQGESGAGHRRALPEASLSRSFASSIERGEKDVRLSTLLKLAKTLGVSLSQLLKGVELCAPLHCARAFGRAEGMSFSFTRLFASLSLG